MKKIGWMLVLSVWACSNGFAQDITVIKPLDSGGIAVISNSDKDSSAKSAEPVSKSTQPQQQRTAASKARIVVVPAVYATGSRSRMEREVFEKLGISDPSAVENADYSGHLTDALVNCRKFDVLERERLSDVAKELDFGESEYADVAKCVQLGQLLNADYVVIPTIRNMYIMYEERDVPYVGGTSREYRAQIGTQVRVVDVATSRIASSNIGESDFKEREPRRDIDKVKFAVNLLSNIYTDSAKKETEAIIDAVYPIKVLALNGGDITINRGKGSLEVGEKLALFRGGELLVDPDTNEVLGSQEIGIGQIEVVDVKPKFSVARIIALEEGQAVQKRDIARRLKEEKKAYKRVNPPTRPKID